MKTHSNSLCPLCGGKKTKGKTTFTADLGFGVVVIRQVPAMVCAQCGAEWMDDKVAQEVESIVSDARKKKHTVEVTSFSMPAKAGSYAVAGSSKLIAAKEPGLKYGKQASKKQGK